LSAAEAFEPVIGAAMVASTGIGFNAASDECHRDRAAEDLDDAA
jgi:hypothetical protein